MLEMIILAVPIIRTDTDYSRLF